MKQLVFLKCKCCGADLTVDKNTNLCTCQFCGSSFDLQSDDQLQTSDHEDFVIFAGVLEKYTGISIDINIPEGVLVIGKQCFQDISTINRVTLPNSLIKIEDEAFCGCTSLKDIHFPESLNEIGEAAFKQSAVEFADLSHVSSIGKDAFMECRFLKQVILPKGTSIVYNRTFKQCENLSEVDCSLHDFCLSFKPSNEAKKQGDPHSTLFDAFQATPYFHQLKQTYLRKECLLCGQNLTNAKCDHCGSVHVDLLGGCYIASAVYGSYDCESVWVLRRYRDNILAKNRYGRAFIHMYYALSPLLVKRFGQNVWFKRIGKKKLDKIVAKLQAAGFESTPYEDIG